MMKLKSLVTLIIITDATLGSLIPDCHFPNFFSAFLYGIYQIFPTVCVSPFVFFEVHTFSLQPPALPTELPGSIDVYSTSIKFCDILIYLLEGVKKYLTTFLPFSAPSAPALQSPSGCQKPLFHLLPLPQRRAHFSD